MKTNGNQRFTSLRQGPAMTHKLVYAHLALFPQGGNA